MITALIDYLKNFLEGCILTDEGDISNHLRVSIKNNPDGEFQLSQSHLVDKIIIHIGLTTSVSIKLKEPPVQKMFLHKDISGLTRKWICNYRSTDGMLSCLQGSKQPEF